MLRLVLWNSAETEQFNIDLYENIPVEVTYQFSDIQNINSSVGNYSQTFRVPATKPNLDFFGAVIMPSVVASSGTLINDNFDIKKKIRAELSDGGVTIIQGFVQVKGIYRQKKEFHELELILFGETVDLAKSLGDNMLSDLDMSSLDHSLNYTNVALSWIGSFTSPFNGDVRYGLMDKGFNWSFDIPDNIPFTDTDGLQPGEFTPFLRVRWILDKIFETAGFTYTSNFFSHADFDKVMLPAFSGSLSPVSTDFEPETILCGVLLNGDFTPTNSSSYFQLPLKVYVAGGGYDYTGNFDSTTYRYTAPYGGLYHVEFNFFTDGVAGVVFRIKRNSDTVHTVTVPSNTGYAVNSTYTITLQASDELHVTCQSYGGTVKEGDLGIAGATWMRILTVTEPLYGQTVGMSNNMPLCKQIDFIASLQKMYNLVIIPDKITPKNLIIEPYQDYITLGVSKDWTNKIDFTKDVEIKPTTDIQSQSYSWQNSAGGDFINEAVIQSLDRVYGRYKVLDPENDFATGENKITTSFASYILSNIPGSSYPIHRLIDSSGDAIEDPLPRIANWVGLASGSIGDISVQNDLFVTLQVGFPYMSSYSVANPNPGDEDLNFGVERPFTYIDAHPANTLYWKYWAQYVTELYSSDSRIMSLFVNLSNVDIHNFRFNDKVYIENEYWRILSIENYDATATVPTKVTLIKVLSDLPLCADIPTGYKSTSNEITFNNSNFDYGSKTCCEQYGYVWRPRVSRCYPAGTQSTPTTNE